MQIKAKTSSMRAPLVSSTLSKKTANLRKSPVPVREAPSSAGLKTNSVVVCIDDDEDDGHAPTNRTSATEISIRMPSQSAASTTKKRQLPLAFGSQQSSTSKRASITSNWG